MSLLRPGVTKHKLRHLVIANGHSDLTGALRGHMEKNVHLKPANGKPIKISNLINLT